MTEMQHILQTIQRYQFLQGLRHPANMQGYTLALLNLGPFHEQSQGGTISGRKFIEGDRRTGLPFPVPVKAFEQSVEMGDPPVPQKVQAILSMNLPPLPATA